MADIRLFPGASLAPHDEVGRDALLGFVDSLRERVESGEVRALVAAELGGDGSATYHTGVGEASPIELRGLTAALNDLSGAYLVIGGDE